VSKEEATITGTFVCCVTIVIVTFMVTRSTTQPCDKFKSITIEYGGTTTDLHLGNFSNIPACTNVTFKYIIPTQK
jgi:hypothetical protein